MRLSTIRASVTAMGALIAVTACAGHGVVPTSSAPLAPMTFDSGISPLKSSSCAKTPPQWMWIFKGACVKFALKSTGSSFSLPAYENISVTGSIGYNNAKGSVTIYLADAIDKNGDIDKDKGKSFPPYKAAGTTVVYAVADNQSTQIVKPIFHKNVPILKYVVTDKKGFPGKMCGAAYLAKQRNGTLGWNAFPTSFAVKGDKVTITQYDVPQGLELPAKNTGLYFAINCFNQ